MTNAVALIRVQFSQQDEFIYAKSSDLPGLHVVGRYRESVEEDVTHMIKQLYRLQRSLNVQVARTVEPSDFRTPTPSGNVQTFCASPEQLLAA